MVSNPDAGPRWPHATDLGRVAESDSDSDIDNYSNRGNKLKKGARFAHKGQLVPSNGPSSYREVPNIRDGQSTNLLTPGSTSIMEAFDDRLSSAIPL